MMQEEDWPRVWTKQIGAAVLRHRKRLGLSAQALSDKCAEVGFPIPRTTIANLENGRKEAVPVHEVLILAKALDVAPLDLLFPIALDDGVRSDLADTLREGSWFAKGVAEQWDPSSEFAIYLAHGARLRSILYGLSRGWNDARIAVVVDSLVQERKELELRGLPLPELPAEIDEWLEVDELGIPAYRQRLPEGYPDRYVIHG